VEVVEVVEEQEVVVEDHLEDHLVDHQLQHQQQHQWHPCKMGTEALWERSQPSSMGHEA
jgi:hypothetical protein